MNIWAMRIVQAVAIFFIVIANWALEPYVSPYLFGFLQIVCVLVFIGATMAKFALRRDPDSRSRKKTEAFLKLEAHKRLHARPLEED